MDNGSFRSRATYLSLLDRGSSVRPQFAHPYSRRVTERYLRNIDDLEEKIDAGLLDTKWGRCRENRRRQELRQEKASCNRTMSKIVEAKWNEDEYVEKLTEEQMEQEARDDEGLEDGTAKVEITNDNVNAGFGGKEDGNSVREACASSEDAATTV